MAFFDKLKKAAEDVSGKVSGVADELVDSTKKLWDENSDTITQVAGDVANELNELASKVEDSVKDQAKKD